MDLAGAIHHHRPLLLRPIHHHRVHSKRPNRICLSQSQSSKGGSSLRTCRNCKKQYDPAANTASSCQYHTAHFGGETRRKFESVHTGGTMDTPEGGKVFQYWHCCGSDDPFHPGCTAAPHSSYDD